MIGGEISFFRYFNFISNTSISLFLPEKYGGYMPLEGQNGFPFIKLIEKDVLNVTDVPNFGTFRTFVTLIKFEDAF